jgi:PiT family inorganic phosphate transporter
VRWQVAQRIVWAWIFTIPAAALIAAAAYAATGVVAAVL